jgi:hypothetical protein
LLSLHASGQIIFFKPSSRICGESGDLPLLIDFMSAPGLRSLASPGFCFIATALSASTGLTAPDKVDRLEARTAFRAQEPDAQPEVAEPDAQQEAAVVAVSDAQREAVVAPDVAAAELDAQREAAEAAASGAQQEAAEVESDAQRAPEPLAVARLLAASVEPAETAADRFWFPATTASAAALGQVVSAAKVQAAVDW